MFKSLPLSDAVLYSAVIAVPCLIAGIILFRWQNKFCRSHEQEADNRAHKKATRWQAFILILFAISGAFLGNLLNILITYSTAISHGMVRNPDTGVYDLTYGEMQTCNRRSIKETNIDIDDLKGRIVIYVRYDCPDCMALHDQLAQINDVVFLASRTELGKKSREVYGINLTEVPQGAYIDIDGSSTTVNIVHHDDDGSVTLDLQQIAILREMADRHEPLTSK